MTVGFDKTIGYEPAIPGFGALRRILVASFLADKLDITKARTVANQTLVDANQRAMTPVICPL